MTERIDSERAETECSGQEDGVGVEHKKKEQNEHEPDEEPKKKKKKVKHSSKERVWKKKEGMPVTTAVKSPLKSPPALVSPTPTTAGTTADDVFTKEQAIKASTSKSHVGSVSDTIVNQKSSSKDGHHGKHEDRGRERVSRRNSQRSGSSSDQQYSKASSSSRDAGRTSSSDYGDDVIDITGSHRRERHDSSSSRHQSRRERHDSSSSRLSYGRRDNSSSDRQGVKWDGSRWDQQPSEVVKNVTSQQQYELGDKVHSWSGESNKVDFSVNMGSKRHRDDQHNKHYANKTTEYYGYPSSSYPIYGLF